MPDAPRRSLLPQEHGAYGQLALPLVTGLFLGRPTGAGLALAAAAALAFLAHEPLLVSLGRRGFRARREEGRRALEALAGLGGLAAACGAAGLLAAPPAARLAVLAPLALGGAVAALVWREREKTLAGELVVAAALSSCALPVSLAGGATLGRSLAAWATWVLAFGAATFAVHAVLSRSRARGGRDAGAGAAAAVLAVGGGAAAAAALSLLPWASVLALAPAAALSLALSLLPVEPRRLRQAGWGYVAAGALAAAVLLAGLR